MIKSWPDPVRAISKAWTRIISIKLWPLIVIKTKAFRKISGILIPLIVIALYLCPIPVMANDHKRNEIHAKQYKSGKGSFDSNDRKKRRLKSKDEGNELTGLATAWLLGAANLTVLLSLLLKGANRYLHLNSETKKAVKRFNQFQKKHLMRFHYLLNPLALCIGFLHFLLSCCRKTALPEWGLLFLTVMFLVGLMVKSKVIPQWLRKSLYLFHTSWIPISAMILVLIIGHLMVE